MSPVTFHTGAYLEGRVTFTADLQLPVELVVAVNGTIEATTRTYLSADIRDLWTVMLPEEAFHEGHNDVQIFQIQKKDDTRELRPWSTTSPTAIEQQKKGRPHIPRPSVP